MSELVSKESFRSATGRKTGIALLAGGAVLAAVMAAAPSESKHGDPNVVTTDKTNVSCNEVEAGVVKPYCVGEARWVPVIKESEYSKFEAVQTTIGKTCLILPGRSLTPEGDKMVYEANGTSYEAGTPCDAGTVVDVSAAEAQAQNAIYERSMYAVCVEEDGKTGHATTLESAERQCGWLALGN